MKEKYSLARRIVLCCVLCAAMTLSACTPAQPEEPGTTGASAPVEGGIIPAGSDDSALGRFVEQAVSLPVELNGNYYCTGFRLIEDTVFYGAVRRVDSTAPAQALLYEMSEEGVFTDVTPEWLKAPNADIPQDFRLNDFDVLPNGDAYLLYQYFPSNEEYDPAIEAEMKGLLQFYNKKADALTLLDITYDPAASDVFALGNGAFLLLRGDTAYCFSAGDTAAAAQFPIMGEVYAYDSGKVAARSGAYAEQDGYLLVDAASGSVLSRITPDEMFPLNERTNYFTALFKDDTGVYVMTLHGIYFQQSGTVSWQQLVDGGLSPILGRGKGSCNGMVRTSTNEFYIALDSAIYRYYFDSSVKSLPDGRLRVYSLTENEFVRQAIADFQKANPNYALEYEIADSTLSHDDNVKQLNAKIAGGSAADVLILDNLPWETYADKGVLLDLRELMKPVLESENYFSNVLAACETEKGLFMIPSRFNPLFAMGTKGIRPSTGSLASLADYAAQSPSPPVFVPHKYLMDVQDIAFNNFLPILYSCYGAELYDGSGKITADSLNEWLIAAKALYDNMVQAGDTPGLGGWTEQEQYRLLGQGEGSLTFIPNDIVAMVYCGQARRFEGITAWYTGLFMPGTIVGVNTASEHPEKAAELASLLFTESNQMTVSYSYRGTGVYRQCSRDQMDMLTQAAKNGFEEWYNEDLDTEYPNYNATDADADWYIAQLEADSKPVSLYMDNLSAPDAILAAMQELTPDYFQGKKALHTVQSELMNRIQLMQNE